MRRWLSLALLLATLTSASAQLKVSIECERSNYLLFAPVVVRVLVQNLTEQDIVLKNNTDSTWLTFLVKRSDGLLIHPDQKFVPETLMVKGGETKVVSVNLTPYYAFREPDNYKTQASVDLGETGQFMSGSLQFNVVHGRKVWTKTRPIDGSERTYTLIRFTPDNTSTELYLRVDDEKENVVYNTVLLGQIIADVNPQAYFDKEENLHVLHTAAQGNYAYTRLNKDGVIENQSRYFSLPEAPPRLVQPGDGTVLVAGGKIQGDEAKRDRLSDATFGLTDSKQKPAAQAPAGANK